METDFTPYEDTPSGSSYDSDSSGGRSFNTGPVYSMNNGHNIRARVTPPSSSSSRRHPNHSGHATPTRMPRSSKVRSRRGIKPPAAPRPRSRRGPPTSEGDFVKSSAGFLGSILGKLLWIVQKPLAWLAAIFLVYIILGVTWIWLRNSVLSALSPLCAIPGMIVVGLPFCNLDAWSGSRESRSSDFPKLIDLQSHFTEVLEDSVGGSAMALDLKNSEIAVRDLNSLVRHSSLLSRDDLSSRLDDFVTAAKSTSRQLSKFSSRVGGVVDHLLAMDEYAIKSLEAVAAAQKAEIPSSVTSLLLFPFRTPTDVAAEESAIRQTFIQTSSVMDTSIQRLIIEAKTTLRELDDLDAKLWIIADIVARENGLVTEREQQVLEQIWTTLGGNRGKLANFESHKYLLANIGKYRKTALMLVSRSLLQLQSMQEDLETLRDKVAESELIEEVPLEVHIQSIRRGTERLSEGMGKAKQKEDT